ncbi:hypothetical protein [Martelella sp. AMO21009]
MPTDAAHKVTLPSIPDADDIKPPPVPAPPEGENTANATHVTGKADPKNCKRQACYLCQLIYKDPPPKLGFTTLFPDKIAQADKNWEEWAKRDQQTKTGLVARLYKVKGYDPDSSTDVCPPTLVFRGTDGHDMRGFALCVTFEFTPSAGTSPLIDLQSLVKDILPGGHMVFGMGPDTKGKTRAQLIEKNFESVTLLDETGHFTLMGVPYQGRVTLEFFGGPDGDWATNIEQGLGVKSQQYENAMAFGRSIVKEKIKPGKDRRLTIAGHSLGGGLASATATVVDYYNPKSIFTYCQTFNAAGVNSRTVEPALLGSATIDAFAVRDEILTTIETRVNDLPILGAVLKWAKAEAKVNGFPPPEGNFAPRLGISPGPAGGEGWQAPPKGGALPKVWPIAEQTVLPGVTASDFRYLNEIDSIMNSSASFMQALTTLAARIPEWMKLAGVGALSSDSKKDYLPVYSPDKSIGGRVAKGIEEGLEALSDSNAVSAAKTILELSPGFSRVAFAADIWKEIKLLKTLCGVSAAYHGMDYVIATYDGVAPPPPEPAAAPPTAPSVQDALDQMGRQLGR